MMYALACAPSGFSSFLTFEVPRPLRNIQTWRDFGKSYTPCGEVAVLLALVCNTTAFEDWMVSGGVEACETGLDSLLAHHVRSAVIKILTPSARVHMFADPLPLGKWCGLASLLTYPAFDLLGLPCADGYTTQPSAVTDSTPVLQAREQKILELAAPKVGV